MARYTTRPSARITSCDDDGLPDAETKGDQTHEDGSWSDDQPTGLLSAQGEMIYRVGRSIGFLADN